MSSPESLLNAPDTREGKLGLALELSTREDLLYPIYVISHRRTEVPTLTTFPRLAFHDQTYLVVAEHEVEEYCQKTPLEPGGGILAIPSDYRAEVGMGVGRARQFCLDHAAEQGHEVVLIVDDDIVNLRVMYSLPNGEVSSAFGPELHRKGSLRFGIMVMAHAITREAFAAWPEAVLSAPVGPGSRGPRAAATRYATNAAPFPIQFVFWHVKRWREMVGELDLQGFNRHGEDIWAALSVLRKGGSTVVLTSVIRDTWSSNVSVIRSPENELQLKWNEYNTLHEQGFGEIMGTRWKPEGYPGGSRPNWKKLNALGLAPRVEVPWDEYEDLLGNRTPQRSTR